MSETEVTDRDLADELVDDLSAAAEMYELFARRDGPDLADRALRLRGLARSLECMGPLRVASLHLVIALDEMGVARPEQYTNHYEVLEDHGEIPTRVWRAWHALAALTTPTRTGGPDA